MVNKMEVGLNPESGNEKFDIVPAEKEMGTKNCIVINNVGNLEATDIERLAIQNEAFEKDEDEAPDDTYVIQFPGHQQERLTEDGVSARLREIKYDDGKE